MKPEIVSKPAFKLAGLARTFSAETRPEIPKLWDEFIPREEEISRRKGENLYGVVHFDLSTAERARGCFVYMVAAEVDSFDSLPPGMAGREIAPARYAVFTCTGGVAGLLRAVDYVWGEWLPKSGYEDAEAPVIELYDERFAKDPKSGEIELWIPIREG